MVSKSDYRFIKNVGDVVGFLLITVLQIIRTILLCFIPKSYLKVKNLNGEIILITGGGGGIGRLLALRVARLNAKVIVWDIFDEGIEETVKLVEGVGGKAFGYRCDISNRHDVYKVAKKTLEEVGPVTILVNNAGVASGRLLLDTPDELIQRTFDVNTISHFWTTKAFLPNMLENNHGHIVTIASMAGLVGVPKMIDYCASKYAAVGFDESLRLELESLGAHGVKTTCICPFFIRSTGMFNDVCSRFVPRLNANDVADTILDGITREKQLVTLPVFFQYCLFLKWIMPFPVVSMFLRNLVPDAAPNGGTNIGKLNNNKPEIIESKATLRKAQNNIKQQNLPEKTL